MLNNWTRETDSLRTALPNTTFSTPMEKVYCVFLTMSKEMCGGYREVQRLEDGDESVREWEGKKWWKMMFVRMMIAQNR